jgi:PII-like signaling protein
VAVCGSKRCWLGVFLPAGGLARLHFGRRFEQSLTFMDVPRDSILLRIFIGESDRWQHQPLYEAIVKRAREMHLGGATVLRGPMGFGKSSRMHTAKILRLSMDLPILIEIVDSEDKINGFLPELEKMMTGGLVTLERVQVIEYRHVQRQD